MFKKFAPTHHFQKITDIPADFFDGAELVIFDLDNTLVFAETLNTKPDILAWFFLMKKKYPCIIFSNSFSYFDRAKAVEKLFDCELFLSKSKKPFKKLFTQMQQKYHVDPVKIFVVGDRVMTDILFGNSNGTKTVLVDSLGGKENFLIGASRMFDEMALFFASGAWHK